MVIDVSVLRDFWRGYKWCLKKNAVPVHLLKKNYFSHILWLFRRIRELSNLEPLQNLQRLYLGMNRIQVSCLLKSLVNTAISGQLLLLLLLFISHIYLYRGASFTLFSF